MSSQAERIKAFKLSQHARLQKQDEEEQWISSEELCTEGSSDEETHISSSSCKSSHRKQKRNPRSAEKRGISPLAQPPKTTESESTSVYQRDSKYLLPDIQSSHLTEKQNVSAKDQQSEEACKVGNLNLSGSGSSGSSSTSKVQTYAAVAAASARYISQESEETTDEEPDIEELIQWRPKRGSIKLPDFPEDRSTKRSLDHMFFEVDCFYQEMNARMGSLKRRKPKSKFTLFSEFEEDNHETESLFSLYENKSNNPNVNNLMDKIFKLDEKIIENEKMLQTFKEERKSIQDEMCDIILHSEVSPSHSKHSQLFLHLCSFEDSTAEMDVKENSENEYDKSKSDEKQRKTKKKPENSDKNFITRNIELAKQNSMMQFSLTDEEKLTLESILSDLDSEEYSVNQPQPKPKSATTKVRFQNTSNNEKSKKGKVNQFKMKDDDISTLQDLDSKLREMSESDETEAEKALLPHLVCEIKDSKEDALEIADKEGRYWRHHNLQEQLRNIDKRLADIAAKDAEEKEKMEKQNQQEIAEISNVETNKVENESANKEDSNDKS